MSVPLPLLVLLGHASAYGGKQYVAMGDEPTVPGLAFGLVRGGLGSDLASTEIRERQALEQ